MNNTKTLKIMRAISLAVLALYFIPVLAGSLFSIPMSDAVIRFTGIIVLLALPMAAFASMRIHLLKKVVAK